MGFVTDWKTLVKTAKSAPDTMVSLGEWPGRKLTAEAGRTYMQGQIQRKISQFDERAIKNARTRKAQRITYSDGREKHAITFKKYADPEYLYAWAGDRDRLTAIRENRTRVYQFATPYYRKHFGYLLAHYDD